jgi:hypothetical protein
MTAASAGPASAAPRPDWRLVIGFAALTILIHFLTNGAYGYFRDELYFMACGDHLAWGYVDLPPMVALVARFSRAAMGDSLFALRFFPALAGGATVAIAGILAWELGGGRFAQVLAMLAAMLAPAYLGVANLRKCCNFENGDGGGPERNWAARSQAARSNSWSMN